MKLSNDLVSILLAGIFISVSSCLHVSETGLPYSYNPEKVLIKTFSALPGEMNLNHDSDKLIVYKIFAPWCQSCLHEIALIESLKKNSEIPDFDFRLVSTAPANETDFSGFKFKFIPEIVEALGIQQVPQTYIFKDKALFQVYSRPMTKNDFDWLAKQATKTANQLNRRKFEAPYETNLPRERYLQPLQQL